MPEYLIRVIPVDAPVRDLPPRYRRKADARRDLTAFAWTAYPGTARRQSGPDCIVAHRDNRYVGSISVELAD